MMKYVLILIVALVAPAVAQAQSFEERQAVQVVEEMASDVFQAVRGGSEAQRASRLVSVIQRHVELDQVSQSALGAIWDELTPSQRSDFTRIYVEMIASQYALAFDGRGGERFRTLDTFELAGGQIRVRGEVNIAGEAIPVGFIVGAGYRDGIRNIILNDVALVDRDRQVFEATWEASGQDYAAFASALRESLQ